ncbi:MAG: hypothetical protein ACOYL6_11085 [Bacteriovoracaceae bacterium]
MKFLSFLLVFLFSLAVLAADTIEIVSPTNLRAGEFHRFQVLYHGATTTTDVTNLTQFSGVNWSPRQNGEFLVYPASYGNQSVNVLTASYRTPGGDTLNDTLTVTVDSTPYYINIMGPFFVYRNSGAQYQAFAQYRDMRKDISFECQWSSFYGMVTGNGYYRTPFNSMMNNDTISCRYGFMTQMFSISIR